MGYLLDSSRCRVALLSLISTALVLGGCALPAADLGDAGPDLTGGLDPDDSNSSSDEVVIHEDVVIVDNDPCIVNTIIPMKRDVLTFEFGCDPVGHGIEPGKIVVGTEHGGYLRRIDSVAFDGWTVRAWTSPASIAEAVEYGGFSLNLGGDAERALIDFSNTILFADSVLGSDVLVKLSRGSFDISPLIAVDGHWADGEVQTFNFDTSFEVETDLELYVLSSNGLRMTKEVDIWESSYPFATAIGPLPVVGRAGVRAKVGFRVDAPGQESVTTGVEGHARWANSRQFRTGEGWTDAPESDIALEFREPELELSTSTKVRAYLRLETFVSFYETAGPEIQADLYSQLSATPDCEGIDWEATAGLMVRAKIKVNILDKFKPTKIWGMVDLTADFGQGTVGYPTGFPVPCAQPEIGCGDVVSGDTSLMQAQLDAYDCNIGNYDAPEAIYEWRAETSGPVEWALVDPTPLRVNQDVMVLEGAMDLLFAQCLTWGSNSVEFEAVAGQVYYLVVDGYDNDAGLFEAALTCE
ncbi:MAG: hypothetical protein VX498_10960 [Myxococcota bacterium]|nr:hypothetical protein [Myxococcota bacterium]